MSTPDPAATSARTRRHDPDRRDHIIDACIDVIATDGVDGTSHRRVAAAAGVPLGSMTYHFTGRDELLREALTRFAATVAQRFEDRLSTVPPGDTEAGVRAVVDLIVLDVFPDPRELVLTHELYTLAAREPAYRTLTSGWMTRSRGALERIFDPLTARLLDALVEGLSIHRALHTTASDDSDVEIAVRRITGAPTTTPPSPSA